MCTKLISIRMIDYKLTGFNAHYKLAIAIFRCTRVPVLAIHTELAIAIGRDSLKAFYIEGTNGKAPKSLSLLFKKLGDK